MKQPNWQYDEMKQCGIDYANAAVVKGYDETKGKLENCKERAEQIIEQLGINSEHVVMDIGCGTGGFTFYTAQKCKQVIAVDVSQAMLDFCKDKCEKAGLDNIEYHRAGFLTYEHTGKPIDAIICRMALHHLSDFWKLIGLRNLASTLKPGGKLYLFDVVFSFDISNCADAIEEWIKTTGEYTREGIETHIREEYSTFDWVMEGLLEKAGFEIEHSDYGNGFLTSYLCIKKAYKGI